jgi:hypothetical protein
MVAKMNFDYEAIEHLKLAISRISKAKRLLQNELTKVEACNDNRLSRSAIEESYVATIDTLNRISFALEDIELEKNITSHSQISDDNLFNFEPSYDENYGFCFRFSRLPNLKSSRGISRMSDRFSIEVGEKIVATIPKNFQKMRDANVIFVSHFLKDGPHFSHYFDNDNLAIKSILDIIVPFICIDDATRYCDNFYLSQHDANEFSELYIVRKGCMKAWAAAHEELDFARSII